MKSFNNKHIQNTSTCCTHLICLGNCSAGYYCNTTSIEPDQYICPAGHYCPEGTGTPIACPAGTYLGTEMNSGLDDCVNCTAGSYCEGMYDTEQLFKCTLSVFRDEYIYIHGYLARLLLLSLLLLLKGCGLEYLHHYYPKLVVKVN